MIATDNHLHYDENGPNIVLYILVRSDMESMPVNGGKAMAQAAHAANQMVKECAYEAHAKDWLAAWEGKRGFGTTITLDAIDHETMGNLVKQAAAQFLHCGVVLDPTYPLRDGETTHYFPCHTCAYVFGPKDRCDAVVGRLLLVP